MGFRMRKSIQVVPGVRLNLSKTGFGASFGVGPGRYTVHSSGPAHGLGPQRHSRRLLPEERLGPAKARSVRISCPAGRTSGSAEEARALRAEGGEVTLEGDQ